MLHCRQYYHSHTCLPLVPEEIDIDSETELETAGIWQKTCSKKVIMLPNFCLCGGGEGGGAVCFRLLCHFCSCVCGLGDCILQSLSSSVVVCLLK